MSRIGEQGAPNSHTVPPEKLYELAYNASIDILKQQDSTLANMRNRASGLLATAALAASFSTSIGLFGARPYWKQVYSASVCMGVARNSHIDRRSEFDCPVASTEMGLWARSHSPT